MYQALYRKWRPQTFDEVIGQKHITETLKNQVMSGRLSHAYIFIGTRGTGKTTCARILAKAVNCESPVNGNPCGHCAACLGISDGSVLDIVELDAASNNSVDNVRALREEAVFSPAAVKKRVYIIDEVHMLSTQAFNALLKILEEPPEHLMFILATTELQKVPATILSRCQRHSFRRIEPEEIAKYLEHVAAQEHIDLRKDAAQLISRLADGGLRDAMSLLDQCSSAEILDADAVYDCVGLSGSRSICGILRQITVHDMAGALKSFSELWMGGKDASGFLGELSSLLRDVMISSVAPKGGAGLMSGSFEDSELKYFTQSLSCEQLIGAMETVQRAMGSLRDARNPRAIVELCLVSLCDDTLGESVNQLRARISRLERQMSEGGPAPSAYRPAQSGIESAERMTPPAEPMEPGDCADDIDPAEFAEEQPEDTLEDRRREAAPAEPESAPTAPESASTGLGPDGDGLWSRVCAEVKEKLPKGLRIYLGDDSQLRCSVEGDVLRIYASPGFVFRCFNKPDVIESFARTASEIAGREMRAALSEASVRGREQRSLDELKAFKEVRFI